jgi:hypothetical protein
MRADPDNRVLISPQRIDRLYAVGTFIFPAPSYFDEFTCQPMR